MIEHGHTRYPVVEESDGQPVGYVDTKDVLAAEHSAGTDDLTAASIAREVPIVPETTRTDELLETFQDEQRQLATVVDEWGSLEGIATVENAVEVVVGDLRDEFDDRAQEPSIAAEDGGYLVDGMVSIGRLNETLETTLAPTTYGTVAGFLLERLDRLFSVGDRVSAEGYRFEVTAIDGTRIERVAIRPAEA